MSLFSKVAKNTVYQIIGKVLGTILGLLTVGLMTRYLGQTGFGYYTTAIAFLQFFGVLIDFGLQMTTAQLLARPQADERKIFANIFTLRLVSAVIFLGLGAAVAWLMPYPLAIKIGIMIAAWSFLFISLQSVLIGLFQKQMAMAEVALAEVWGRGVLLVGVWLAIYLQGGFYYIMLAVAAGSLVNFLLLLIRARKFFPIRFAYDRKIWRDIWGLSWPLAITISLTLVYFRADTVIMSLFRPQSEVGIYGASYKVLEILVQFPYLFLGLILPLLSRFHVEDKAVFGRIFQKAFDFLALIAIPMIFSVWVLGEKIMVFVAGGQFILSGIIIKILILAAAAIYFSSLFGYTIVSAGLQKKMIKFYLIDAVLSLILYLIFIPLYSYWAAAIITVLTEVFIALSSWWILRRQLKISLNLAAAGKYLVAASIMSAAVALLHSQNLPTLVVIGLIVYFAALYFMKGIDRKDILEIINVKRINN